MPSPIPCPSCNQATKLIIGKIGDSQFCPCCPECIHNCDSYSIFDNKRFSLHYLPKITNDKKSWEISNQPLGFLELRKYLDDCCEPATANETEKQFLTADLWLLSAFVNILSESVETPFHGEIVRRRISILEQIITGRRVIVDSKLPWRLLPPGKRGLQKIIDHFTRLKQHRPHIQVDASRLHYLGSFNYDEKYEGMDSFEGYVVFYFSTPNIAVLECAFYSNALYILKEKWRFLSSLSKTELLENYYDKLIRITHDNCFYGNTQKALNEFGITRNENF